MKMLSVILPAYNEEQMIPVAEKTIGDILETAYIPYEIVFVDDGSKDHTWETIESLYVKNNHVVGIHFSRNFGKEAAMFAGLEKAQGDCCVILDCDLQHPPETILEMYRLWQEGYEIVEGVKAERGEESWFYKSASGLFSRMISKAAGIDMSNASDFKLLDRKVVDTLNHMPEKNVFFRAMSYWVGYKKTEVAYSVMPRIAGESKWSTRALFRYALTNIASFSSAPMQIVSWIGGLFLLLSFVLGIQTLVKKICGMALEGFTTVILLQLLASGLIMLSLGIIGFYVARIYEECKGRPRYVISEICGRPCLTREEDHTKKVLQKEEKTDEPAKNNSGGEKCSIIL